jgi:hypothetical protein
MLKPAAIVGQVILYGAFAAFIGYFATWPKYRQIPDDVALIKLSISHLGDRECRKRTPEELAKCRPTCARRWIARASAPTSRLEVDLDGSRFPHRDAPDRPLQGRRLDGVQALRGQGRQHQLAVRMNDNLKARLQLRQGRADHPRPGAGDGDRLQPGPWRPVLQMIAAAPAGRQSRRTTRYDPAAAPGFDPPTPPRLMTPYPFPELTSMKMVKLLQQILRWLFMRIENVFNVAFGDKMNPFYHLGTISFWQFWLLVGSGLYLYIFADTGVHDAFESVERITHDQWWAGGILRSIHRYATDGMILTMLLHMLRHFAYDRYRGFRSFSWLTGVALLWLVYIAGVNGFMLVWDKLAQFVVIATAEWFDVLPMFNGTLIRNFLYPKASTAACSRCSPSSTSAPR